jgi:hypothetical protein
MVERSAGLIGALANWKGRGEIQRGLEDRSLLVPTLYQEQMFHHCAKHSIGTTKGLNRYWDEIARERVCSAGRADSNLRIFRGPSSYRSAYLDQLANSFDYSASPFADPPIDPCLHDFTLARYRNKGLFPALRAVLTGQKLAEASQLGLSAEGWTGKKRDVKPILKRYVEQQGFVEERLLRRDAGQPTRVFCKEAANGLVFQCWVDEGGLAEVLQLPLEFCVTHKDDPEPFFWIGHFINVVPGFEFYGNCVNEPPECCVLGIHAFAQAIELFVLSLEK